MSQLDYQYEAGTAVWYVHGSDRIVYGVIELFTGHAQTYPVIEDSGSATDPHRPGDPGSSPDPVHYSNGGKNVLKTLQYTIGLYNLDGERVGHLEGVPESSLFTDIDDALAEYRRRLVGFISHWST